MSESNLVTKNLVRFARVYSDIQSVYKQAVKDFNPGPGQDWNDLATLLDQNILVAGIDRPKSHVISGIDKVISFLQASGGTFQEISASFQPYPNHGYAIGVANWSDTADTVPSPFLFSFVFLNRSTGAPDWKILRLWGSRPLGDMKE
jgi:hypothetical protein